MHGPIPTLLIGCLGWSIGVGWGREACGGVRFGTVAGMRAALEIFGIETDPGYWLDMLAQRGDGDRLGDEVSRPVCFVWGEESGGGEGVEVGVGSDGEVDLSHGVPPVVSTVEATSGPTPCRRRGGGWHSRCQIWHFRCQIWR